MDSNPYGFAALWQQGDALIKGVALLLLVMSIASWTVILLHVRRHLRLRRLREARHGFWHARSFTEGVAQLDGHGARNPYSRLARDAQLAVSHHNEAHEDLHGQLSLADWLTECLRAALDEAGEAAQRGLPILASVGSTAPFVGLFGTVWGIYHALIGISVAGQASLDKVAGPVGEALVMTAFGLAVAIPAVLGYNALSRANRRQASHLQQFARQLRAYFLTGAPLAAAKEA